MRGVVVDPVQQTAVVQGPFPLLVPSPGPALVYTVYTALVSMSYMCTQTSLALPIPCLSCL